jgi:hypothetical protein
MSAGIRSLRADGRVLEGGRCLCRSHPPTHEGSLRIGSGQKLIGAYAGGRISVFQTSVIMAVRR